MLILAAWVAAQTGVAVAAFFIAKSQGVEIDPRSLGTDGFVTSLAVCVSAPIMIAGSWLFARLRKGMTVQEYLCLHRPEKKQHTKWIFALCVLALLSDFVTVVVFRRPMVPDVIVEMYRTARFAPLLWVSVVIAAPLGEETLFRGFLFRGIQNSRAGATGAILISSLSWSALHADLYDLYGVASVFVGGLLLGVARLKTNSIYVPIVMHALYGAIAIAEVAVYKELFLR